MTQQLERGSEHSLLNSLLDDAARGRGGVVVIEGPAGIGKSSLVEHARVQAKQRGFGRLRGSGDLADTALPWGVVRQLVERSITRYAGEVRSLILDGPAGRALQALDGAPGSAASDDTGFARTLHALWWVAVDLSSTRPLLITVDDAHWADLPSQRFLTYLARRVSDLPVALIVATRPPQDPGGPLSDLTSGRLAEVLVPQPLSTSALGELAGLRGEEAASVVITALRTATGGNPLLAGQLLDELTHRGLDLTAESTADVVPEMGPQSVSRSLLTGLSSEATALAGALAVLGRRGDLETARTLVGLDESSSLMAADELVTGNVLENARSDWAFVHPVVREAVLSALRPGGRAGLHARAAQVLHARGARPEHVAAHLVRSPVDSVPDGVGVLRAAAAALISDGDARTAAGHLQRAWEATPDDMDLRAELGAALLSAGEPEAARSHLLAAASSPCGSEVRADRLQAAALATSRSRGPDVAAAELERVIDDFGVDHSPARLVLEARLASLRSLTSAGLERTGLRLLQFEDLPGHTQDERTLLALLAQRAFYSLRPSVEVAALATRALAYGRYFDEIGADPLPWGNALHALVLADGTEAALQEIAHVRHRLSSGGSPLEFSLMSTAAAMTATRTGHVRIADEAAADALSSLVLVEREPAVAGLVAVCVRLAAQAALDRGDPSAAAAQLRDYDASWPEQAAILPVQRVGLVRSALALAQGAPQTALSLALETGAQESAAGLDNPAIPWRVLAAVAAQRCGDLEQARSLSSDQWERAQAWGAASDIGTALRLRARVDPPRRLELLTHAVEMLEEAPAQLELAAALVDLGEALRVARRRTEARDPLRRGAELAESLGALAVRARAVDGLGALGDRPRKLMFSGSESLTGSERRVAELAGSGRSNRDIAQELFVTPKTVENHLGRVYVKLGITGRKELVGALAPA
ncbi:AAA family ATPase [Nocardioides psychrotolerans]|uniref:helix-turn-helix transcriptional regulator n=1 Tax=Nocardioides psychrotolerans TaxID=1005945 RepID=UPI00313805F4